MDRNLVGNDKKSQSGQGDPAPTGTSLAVRQFCAAAFGWVPVHSPSQPWRVVKVDSDQLYCLGCFGVRTFDVVHGVGRSMRVCRVCGEEVRSD